MDIEFDRDKAVANQRKHGVSFDEAISALSDERALSKLEIRTYES